MHAYALVEVNMGNYPDAAEEMALVARGMDKRDNWALNALVHVRDFHVCTERERGVCVRDALMVQ
jgi:hypothetical protein